MSRPSVVDLDPEQVLLWIANHSKAIEDLEQKVNVLEDTIDRLRSALTKGEPECYCCQ